jgi:hypothetical protein
MFIVILISMVEGVLICVLKLNIIGYIVMCTIDSFIILPLHGYLLGRYCRKNCINCKIWNCRKYQFKDVKTNAKNI